MLTLISDYISGFYSACKDFALVVFNKFIFAEVIIFRGRVARLNKGIFK